MTPAPTLRDLRDSLPSDADRVAGLVASTFASADAAGLVEVAYCEADTAVGRLLLAATERGLVRVAFAGNGLDAALDDLAACVSPRVVRAPARLDRARRQIDEFLEGRRRAFDLPLDWRLVTGFATAVLRRTAVIPFGETLSYSEVAAAAGSPRAARAAGSALAGNPLPLVVPCHRVLPRSGGVGGYAGGTPVKEALLRLEGSMP